MHTMTTLLRLKPCLTAAGAGDVFGHRVPPWRHRCRYVSFCPWCWAKAFGPVSGSGDDDALAPLLEGGVVGDVVDSTAYPSEMGKIVEQGNDGVRARLGNKHVNTGDVPRFGALLWR